MQTSQKKKAADPSLKDCANCETNGAKLTCAKCKATHYCSKACQTQHWKNGHKALCVTPEERRPRLVASVADKGDIMPAGAADTEGDGGECPICLESFSGGTLCTLPCTHEFHIECVEALRNQGVQQACPLCRTTLPPGPEKLFEDASCLYVRAAGRHRAAGGSWKPRKSSEEEHMALVIELLTKAANQGHVRAHYSIGFIYFLGSGVAQDYKKAVQWTQKAADQGFSDAQFQLGTMYYNGDGVVLDYKKAVRWFRKAADQGSASAQVNLGEMYNKGKGVAQNYDEAARLFRKAADQGLDTAQFFLANTFFYGEGAAQDYKKAEQWYRKAAHQDFPMAQLYLGTMYADGKGVAQDHKKAVWWFRKAADQGYANAQYSLGNKYLHGEGVTEDNIEAERWFRKAADQSLDTAQYNLGIMYHEGRGVAQDYKEAVRWFRKAADQGFASAQSSLGIMYRDGMGVAQDLNEALLFLSAAEAQGDEEAGEFRKEVEAALCRTSSECPSLEAPSPSKCTCCGRGADSTVKLKPCPRCKGPIYCGKDCQKEHWKKGHKESCIQK